jgi:hypothetical protein
MLSCSPKLLLLLFCLTLTPSGEAQAEDRGNTSWPPEALTPIPLNPGSWQAAYYGGGTITFSEKGILLEPARTESAEDSHAALLVSREAFPVHGYAVEVEMELVQQLRSPQANPWESFWLFFQYAGSGAPGGASRGKLTNYLALKTNGLEAGRAWGEKEQAFLLSRNEPRLLPGTRVKVRLEVDRAELRIFLNDKLAASCQRRSFFQHPGRLGLYAEDAAVRIYSVGTRRLREKQKRRRGGR